MNPSNFAFAIRQTILYERPDASSRRIGYVSINDLLEKIQDSSNGFLQVRWFNKTGYVKVGYTADFVEVFEDDIWVHEGAEIDAAITMGRAYQFISLKGLGIKRSINRNLCGEFCAAQIARIYIIEFLRAWLGSDPGAKSILQGDKTTGTYHLQRMLESVGLPSSVLQMGVNEPLYPGAMAAITPAIVGCGIDVYGRVKRTGGTRHWVVLHELKPQANSGWCKIYNPYWNRMETVLYDELPYNGKITAVRPLDLPNL